MRKPQPEPTYLGDGAYAQVGSYHGEIVLTTGAHSHYAGRVDNRIVLGPTEIRALIRFLMSVGYDFDITCVNP